MKRCTRCGKPKEDDYILCRQCEQEVSKKCERIPMSIIDDIYNDIRVIDWYGDDAFWDGVDAVCDIIDKHINEHKNKWR